MAEWRSHRIRLNIDACLHVFFSQRAELEIISTGKAAKKSLIPVFECMSLLLQVVTHRPYPSPHTSGHPTIVHTPRGVNDLDRDADASFYPMHTYLTIQLVMRINLDRTKPNS